jgi:nucleoside-diphosphate kinase
MYKTRTFAMLKPDAVKNNYIGEILCRISKEGFTIRAIKMTHLSHNEAARFYRDHKNKDFFEGLLRFITSGPVIAMILEGDNAVENFRQVLGKTNPLEAAEGTIRKQFATDMRHNAVHGSDSEENAKREWSFFFAEREID